MRSGREIDARIAKEVFGYDVSSKGDALFEQTAKGERSLRNYSTDMEWAQEVLKK